MLVDLDSHSYSSSTRACLHRHMVTITTKCLHNSGDYDVSVRGSEIGELIDCILENHSADVTGEKEPEMMHVIQIRWENESAWCRFCH